MSGLRSRVQYFAHFAHDNFGSKGFLHEGHAGAQNSVMDDSVIGVAGHVEDFDGGIEENLDDDRDSTLNGINERFLFIINIEVTNDFLAASGNRPFTTGGLPIRLMVEDDSGNRSYLSTWREQLFDYDNWMWRTVPTRQMKPR